MSIVVNGATYTHEELQKIADACFDRTSFAQALRFTYFNGKISGKITDIVERYGISIDHFDKSKKTKARRKYPIIKKNCPVCGEEFETQQGHPRESITCSCKCANTLFSDQKHGPEQRLKTSHALLKRSGSPILTELVDGELRFNKECALCNKAFYTYKKDQEFCSRSCSTRHNWEDEDYRANLVGQIKQKIADGTHKGWASRSKLEPSFPEKVTIELIEELGFKLERELKVHKWFIDFADIDRKIAVEIDGKQHELPERKASDSEKDAYLTSQGWQVHRIKWKKLTPESREELKKKLSDILNQSEMQSNSILTP
jgi:very-short-patch-repair endonuclease/predicted nucleic acid-binding Zn ribbon protein